VTEQPVQLVVGTPCYGGMVSHLYTASLLKLQHACSANNIGLAVLMQGGDALITRARQNLVAHFLGNQAATHLLFIDADIAFEPAQVFRLLGFKVEIAAGVYPTKRIDWPRVQAQVRAGRDNLESGALSYVLEFDDPARIEQCDGFARARYAGTGFLLIRRDALLRMIGAYPDLRYTREHQQQDPLAGSPWRYALFDCVIDPPGGTYLSEDYSFCKRWRDIGGSIWIDLQSRLTHIGAMPFIGDLATQFAPLLDPASVKGP
jgi:hypothetical protein